MCTHWWRITFPQGPTSAGVCLKCGAVGEFRNSVDEWGPERRYKAHVMYVTPGEKLTAELMVKAYQGR